MKIIPNGFVSAAPLPRLTLLRMRNTIPMKLRATPPAFFHVIGSFNATAATNMVKIGVIEVMMEVSNGVVMVMASRNSNCVRNRPNMEAKNIFIKSRCSTFSFGKNSDTNQNKADAPVALMRNRHSGEIRCELLRLLQMMMLNPNMVYATKHERCPDNLLLKL